MFRRSRWVLVALLAGLVTPVARGELKIGDAAPELSLTYWVKGEPVNLARGKGKHVYLIEFWATWCPPCIEAIPHLTELQNKYREQGLIVVGVSGPGRGETLSKVKRFVRRRYDGMDYVVAYDKKGATHARYMREVGAAGIPYAFIVDKSGRMIWHGHPGDPFMDEIIEDVIKGRYDVNSAALREKLTPMFGRLNRMANIGEWESFKTVAKHILSLDPKNESAMDAAIYAYLTMTDDVEGLRKLVEKHIEENREDAEAMHGLALALLRIEELDLRQPDLALRAASVAYEACKGGDCTMIDTYARAVFEIGMVDRAIELQNGAVAIATDEKERQILERVLRYYKTCKALQSEKL